MNQSTRRKTRHLLYFLLTWVVIGAQITLPLGALLAAVQPTPTMVQAVAQQAGLGDWLADAAGKATAWAQPLWGQPKTAAAQATSSPRIYTRNNPTSFLTGLPNTNVDQTVTVYNMAMEETKLSGGWLHHCAINSADALKCWGVNDNGELGIGNTTHQNSPQTPSGIPGTVYTVQGSSDHTCALTYSGDVYCTGFNDNYQLGDGTTTQRTSYVKVLGIADATSIGIGYRHGCATLNTGGIKCWGYNGYGQLGDNSTTTRSAPVMVSGTSGNVYIRVVATELSTCALDMNNAVTCWGYNGEGQLGDGTVAQRLTPVAVTGMSEGVKAIYSGQGRNFCGVMYDGSVKCWGWGGNNGTNSSIPVTISGVSNARMVSVGQVHACAVQFDGTLKCWGDNGYQKVLGAPGGTTWTATAVTGVSGAVDVATTDATTCVRLSSGALQCWGYNGYGQVGDSTNTDRGTPTSVTGYAASGIKAPDAPDSLTISAQAISGTNAGNFSIFGTTCSPLSYTIPTNQNCTYTIRFNGPAYGAYTANLNITADAINSVTTVLNGNVQTAPGGVAANLAAWYKADDTVGTTQWDDASGNGKHMLAAGDGTAARMPTLDATPGAVNNFNPRVAFLSNADANRKWTMTASGNNVFATTTTPGTIFNVSSFPDETVYDVPQMYAFEDDDPGLNLITDRNAANDIRVIFQRDNGGTGSAGWDFNVPGVSQIQPLLTAHAWNYAAGGNTFTFNGYDYTPSTNSFIGATSPRYIFGAETTGAGGEAHSGYTSENIVYSVDWPSNSSERKRINSYLAIKYGITLLGAGTLAGGAADATFGGTADYLDSASTVIWSGTTSNSSYHNNVAGIGRDDASALNQKQSTSTNVGFQPVIGLGTVAASNAANSNSFAADKSFLVWGSNTGVATFAVSYTPSSFTPPAGYYRMTRVWKVQETGTVGNVVVQSSSGDHLLVSSDPTFATGVTEIAMSSGSATVNFTTGQYFTFGRALIAPGAVVNGLAFWSKADDAGCAPGDACADWDDRSTNENPIETTGAMTLQAADAAHNFHPYFSSFSTANYFKDLNSSFATPWPPIDVTEVSVFAVVRANSLTDDGRITGMDNDDNYADEPGLSIFDGSPAFYRFSSGPGRVTLSDDVVVNSSAIFGARTAGTQLTVGLNGKHTASALTAGGGFAGDIFNIGYGIWDINGPFPGDIQEVIWYRTNVSDTERQRIESYLALKYGITLDQSAAQNYLAGDGTTVVWNATAHAAYSNNIAGIGRDDASALNQKQATSTNPGFQPTIGLGTIAASNAANSNTFATNKSFLIWGNNNAATTLTANYNGGSNNRVARVWKVQETGTVGAVKVVIPRSAFPTVGLRSLIVHSSDANFGTVDRTYPLVVSGGNYEATVDFTNGDFFTFSSSFTIPEINLTPGTLDFGEINVGVVSPAQAVTIQNEGEVSLSISNISLSGTDAARFAISSNNCGATLSAGASCTVQITFAPTTAGSHSALLVITSNDSDESTVNVALSGTTPGSGGGGTPGTYNLAVTKSASTANATVGVPFTYTITVYNKGTIAASNVTMTDQLPAGITFGSANATGGGNCNHSSGTVTCTWPSLAGGASATVTISVTP